MGEPEAGQPSALLTAALQTVQAALDRTAPGAYELKLVEGARNPDGPPRFWVALADGRYSTSGGCYVEDSAGLSMELATASIVEGAQGTLAILCHYAWLLVDCDVLRTQRRGTPGEDADDHSGA